MIFILGYSALLINGNMKQMHGQKALLKFYAFSKILVLIRSSANLRHAHQIWQLYNIVPVADMHGHNSHIRFIISIKSLWLTAHNQCSNMSQRRVKVHCAIWLLWKKVDAILHVLISKLCTQKKISSQCASYRVSRERSMTSVKHAWQFRIGEMKCLKCQYISPNLRYLHSPLYFPFRNFHWGVLKISQLISQSKKHEKPSMTTLPELSQIYLCPQFLGIGLKLFYSIWTILKYASHCHLCQWV